MEAKYRASKRRTRAEGAPYAYDRDDCIKRICDRLAETEFGLHKIITEDPTLPSVQKFWAWLDADRKSAEPKGYTQMYTRAKNLQAEYLESQLLEIADEEPGFTDTGSTDSGAVQHQKLRVDTRKWIMGRLYPFKYGDRQILANDPEAPLMPKADLSKLDDKELATLIALRKKLEGSSST